MFDGITIDSCHRYTVLSATLALSLARLLTPGEMRAGGRILTSGRNELSQGVLGGLDARCALSAV